MKKQFARIIAVSEKEAREKVDRHAKVARSLSESMEIVSEKNMEVLRGNIEAKKAELEEFRASLWERETVDLLVPIGNGGRKPAETGY